MDKTIKRGDIYYADLNPVVGSEQGGTRPVLVISNDIGNKHSPTAWHGSMENCLTRTERSRSTTARITNTFWTLPSRFRQGVVTT